MNIKNIFEKIEKKEIIKKIKIKKIKMEKKEIIKKIKIEKKEIIKKIERFFYKIIPLL